MYEWYRDAAECLVYLSTVTAARVNFNDFNNEFWMSEWWHRGWTLQELVAPQRLLFWDRNWHYLNSRHDLGDHIARKTGIPSECRGNQHLIWSTAIATRMSWARFRRTTRLEDTAYSLLGICDINMPLLYGEGTKAFRRLQEAIIARSDDETIFAVNNIAGLFATSPLDFVLEPVVRHDLNAATMNRFFSAVQNGIRMHVTYLDMGNGVWAVIFNCKYALLGRPFFRLVNVVRRQWEVQTTRLYARPHLAQDGVLLKAYEKVADKENRKAGYKHGEAILMAQS